MSHNRIQDPISAYFNSFFYTLAQIKPIFSEFLEYFEKKKGHFGSKTGFFWLKNWFISSRPEKDADFETQPGNCWTWNSLFKPPSYETRAKFNSFLTSNDMTWPFDFQETVLMTLGLN